MADLIIGTSAYPNADPVRLREAGIGWIRQDFPIPFADRLGGSLTDDFLKAREAARAWQAKGFHLMGVTPLTGIGTHKPDAEGNLHLTWNSWLPAWMGEPNTEKHTRDYQEICAFLAQDLRGVVQMWQISNELNIPMFAGPLIPYNACELILQGAIGLKENDPGLIVGPNSALPTLRYYFYGRLFADPRARYLDYCGVDGYYGTWDGGGPWSWDAELAELRDLTRTKILVNEWGYSSAGAVMTREEFAASEEAQSPSLICQNQKWRFGWGSGHNLESQGEFVRQAMDVFREHREYLLGAFFYRWEDQERCWQCDSPTCPAETAWGLVDLQGNPKPAFYAHKEGVRAIVEQES
jgi:hypothetical protein